MAKILLVEDEEQVRTVIRRMLEKEGYEVDEAENGDVALRIYKQGVYDLIITDIIMPDKEGIEMISVFKKKYPDIKIIAVSGGGRIGPYDYLDLALKLGAQKAFKKPFAWNELINGVKEVLESD